MEFFPEIDLNEQQAEAIARGLYTVAAVDGAHDRELALIAQFYGGTRGIAELERSGVADPKVLASQLEQRAHRELFLKTALLLAYADGKVSDAERSAIDGFAKAFGVDKATVTSLEAEVKDYLLRPLAGLKNSESVSKVAKKIGA
jgi:tellurite resistance protein